MTEVLANMQTSYLVLDPAPASGAPNGALFNDTGSGNALTNKSMGGSVVPIGASSSSDIFIKQKQNLSGVTIPIGKRVSLRTDGSICLSDNDDPLARRSIGLSIEEIADSAMGNVLLDGPSATGAVLGLGFAPGDNILLDSVPGGLTNNMSSFDPETDEIMQVGIADCAAGAASGVATDLIMVTAVVSSPG